MKRYRLLRFDFDTRANLLKQDIEDGWEPQVRKQLEQNKREIMESLIAQFGAIAAFRKIENFIDLGELPISITAYHNKFLRQVRDAFVVGSYYPALTGACALGERILNQLIIHLREDFRNTEQYKKVYKRDSFDNWDIAIVTLEQWDVLLPDVANIFRELKQVRHRAIHFNPETDANDRELALGAIVNLQRIVKGQFSGFGVQPWFIAGIPGVSFIKKEYEKRPFIKKILLPSCTLVGPYHRLETGATGLIVKDDHEYEDKEVTDEEFAAMFNRIGS